MIEVAVAAGDAGADLLGRAGHADRVEHLVADRVEHRLVVAVGEPPADPVGLGGEAARLEHRRVSPRRGVERDLGRDLAPGDLLVIVDRAQQHPEDLDLAGVTAGSRRAIGDRRADDLVDVSGAERGMADEPVGHAAGGLDHPPVHARGEDRDLIASGGEDLGGRGEVHRVEATLVLDGPFVQLPDSA